MNKRDPKVQHTASLHETAVQAIAEGKVARTPRTTRRGAQKRTQAVHTHVIVHPEVMAKVKALLLGSYTRIEILDAETVRVR